MPRRRSGKAERAFQTGGVEKALEWNNHDNVAGRRHIILTSTRK